MRHHGISIDAILDIYTRVLRIRRFEEAVGQLFKQGQLPGFVHLYIGEEAVAAGVCAALTDADTIISTHRGHGHVIAKGGDIKRMMAELFGKATGYCKGKGGSMHIADFDIGMLGACGIVGGGMPIAVGAGLSAWTSGEERVSVCFFGDGAANEGSFHESLNLAAALSLPVIFICENNQYGEFTPARRAMNIEDIADRAAGYGIPGVIADGTDALAMYRAASAAVERRPQRAGTDAHRSQDPPQRGPCRRRRSFPRRAAIPRRCGIGAGAGERPAAPLAHLCDRAGLAARRHAGKPGRACQPCRAGGGRIRPRKPAAGSRIHL